MKKFFLSLLLCGVTPLTSAADIVNGWSGEATIVNVHSEWTRTLFYLNLSSGATCGHPTHWLLPINQDYIEASKIKHSLLLAAFAAQKTVNLRCENSQVTDFTVVN